MTNSILILTTWLLIVAVSVMAGVYFAFSTFIMRAFDDVPAKHAVEAMNSINRTIVKSLFLPLFFGSSVLALLQVVLSLTYLQGTPSYLGFISGLTYLITMLLCTALFNVPLNNRLADFDLQNGNADSVWRFYRLRWTRWNHLRTIGSLVSVALLVSTLISI